MMRCLACNVELSDYEATRKDVEAQFIDLCSYCYHSVKDSLTELDEYNTHIVDGEKYE